MLSYLNLMMARRAKYSYMCSSALNTLRGRAGALIHPPCLVGFAIWKRKSRSLLRVRFFRRIPNLYFYFSPFPATAML